MKSSTNTKIFKLLSLFTGTEALGIICSIVKMKLVALWLHAAGVGLFGIFNTTIDTIYILSGLGLRQSAVRDVSANSSDPGRLKDIIRSVRSWGIVSGLLGAAIISICSVLFSSLIFGNKERWYDFIILAVALLFNSLITSEQAILQGCSRFKTIAKTAIISSVVGLMLSIPLYRFCGQISVPISISLYSIIGFIVYFCVRDKSYQFSLPNASELKAGKSFVRLGGYIAAATFMSNLAHMLFVAFINRVGSETEMGLYQAGNTLVIRYMSIIFSAISIEFYPRISKVFHSSLRTSIFVSHEISLLLSIITPMLLIFILLRSVFVKLLYTEDFLAIIPFITIAIANVIFRAVSNCLAICTLARGEGKIFVITETLDAIIGLALGVMFYRRMGLTGIGIALVLWYFIYFLMTGYIYLFKYRLKLQKSTIVILTVSTIVSGISIFIKMAYDSLWSNLTIISFLICYLLFLIYKAKHLRTKR